MAKYIDADKLLAAYDAEHVGAPGRARELIINAPAADVVKRPRWISVKERLPEKSGFVLAYYGFAVVLHFSKKYGKFNAFDDYGDRYAIDATHWQYLPEPQKEETK